MSEQAPITDADVGFGTMLLIEELLRQLIKAGLVNREQLADAVRARKAEFTEESDSGLLRILSFYADTMITKGAS